MPRQAILLISPELFLGLCKPTPPEARFSAVEVTASPLPADASFVRILYDEPRACLALVVESGSFAYIGWHEPLPILESPQFRRTDLAPLVECAQDVVKRWVDDEFPTPLHTALWHLDAELDRLGLARTPKS